MASLFWLCQVSFTPQRFKLDDNSSLRGNVEGYHSGLAYVQTVCYLLEYAILSV